MNAQQLKISILQMAIQGKLVPQDPMDEPAATLLQRIHKERETLARSEKITKGKNCSVIFRDSDNLFYEQCNKDEPICISDEFSFNIPNSWEVVRLNTVCKLTDGEKKSGAAYPIMDANFLRNKGNVKYDKSGKYVAKGEKLILVDGENSGEVFIAPQDGYLGSTFKKLWISKEVFEPYILNFIEFYRVPLKNSKRGAAIPHLDKKKFFNLLLPLPPLEEQRRIVESLHTLQRPIEEYRKAEISLE